MKYNYNRNNIPFNFHRICRNKQRKCRKQMALRRKMRTHISCLSKYQPAIGLHSLYYLNRTTTHQTIVTLYWLSLRNHVFTVNMKNDFRSNKPALIQIELLKPEPIIIFVELFHLPNPTTLLFQHIRTIITNIFNPTAIIQMWGNAMNELNPLINHDLFGSVDFSTIPFVNVQWCFKQWFNENYTHCAQCPVSLQQENHSCCVCAYRLYKNLTNKWSLQIAVGLAFHEFLDKCLAPNSWSIGLDPLLCLYKSSLSIRHGDRCVLPIQYQKERCRQLAQYAINDCLALTELSMLMSKGPYVEYLEQHSIQHLFTV